jgi:hypothetical protein
MDSKINISYFVYEVTVLTIGATLLIIKGAIAFIVLSNSSSERTRSHLTAHLFLKGVSASIDATTKISKC